MNFIRFKQITITILAIPALYFICLLFLSFINKPVIKNINVPDMTNFEFKTNQNDIRDNYNQIESPLTFDYELIGYKTGSNNFFCNLKKRQQRVCSCKR
jgi:hypothetical protein